jgi:hypothetical protein
MLLDLADNLPSPSLVVGIGKVSSLLMANKVEVVGEVSLQLLV